MAVHQVTHLQRFLGQEVRNVYHYETTHESLSAAQLQELADDIRAAWVSAVGAVNQSNDWSLYGISTRRVDVAGIPGIDVGFTSGALAGTATNESLPSQIAMLAHGVAYVAKPNRVRTYLSGLVENHLSDGIWASAAMTARLNLMNALDTLTIDGVSWERVSVEWNLAHTAVVEWNQMFTYFVSEVPATQRRRRIGRGA